MELLRQGAVIQCKQNHTANNIPMGKGKKTWQNCRKHHLLLQQPIMLSWSYD